MPRNPLFGILLQLGATFAFTVMAALVRYIGTRLPLGEVVFARSFFALLPLLVVLVWRRELASAFRLRRPLRHLSRGLTGVGAMFVNFSGLARLPLADASAIGFVTPLFSVALAAIYLGEKVRVWRWSAVVVGFGGVLVMLSPHIGEAAMTSASAFGAALMLTGAFLTASAMTQVRAMSTTESTAALVFTFTIISSTAGLLTLPWGWVAPAPADAAVLVAIGIFGGIGQILITESYRHASASAVAPFSYTTIIWSVALGFFMFGEVPAAIVLIGAAIVVAAGLFVIWRERKLGLDRARAAERSAEGPTAGPTV